MIMVHKIFDLNKGIIPVPHIELIKDYQEAFHYYGVKKTKQENNGTQIELNKKILNLAQKYHIEMIVGLDSHYILPEESIERDYVLESKDIHYENEDGWYMDYPDDNTVIERFLEQGVFTREQIIKAMNNTDICLMG